MSKKPDKEDLRAVKALKTMKAYCESRLVCDGCIFHRIRGDVCLIQMSPVNWDIDEIIKFYEEVNERDR